MAILMHGDVTIAVVEVEGVVVGVDAGMIPSSFRTFRAQLILVGLGRMLVSSSSSPSGDSFTLQFFR